MTRVFPRLSSFIMDIKTFVDNIHEHVCCPVCMTRFTNPKQLPCLHSFCLHCLQRIQQTSGIRDTISCPECRRKFRIPGNGNLNAFQQTFVSTVCWMLCLSQSARRVASSVEIARKQAQNLRTASLVVRSGVMTASLCIIG